MHSKITQSYQGTNKHHPIVVPYVLPQLSATSNSRDHVSSSISQHSMLEASFEDTSVQEHSNTVSIAPD